MSRSVTIIKDEKGQEICVLLRHADGNPTAHGADLKRFLSCFTITNGISTQSIFERKRKFAAGMNCLAAQTIAHFKTGIGNFYLYSAGARNLYEEYRYTIYRDSEGIKLLAEAFYLDRHLLFNGLVEWFDPDHAEESWRERVNRLKRKQMLKESDVINHQAMGDYEDEDFESEDHFEDEDLADSGEEFFVCANCGERRDTEEARMISGGGAVCDECSAGYRSCELCEYYFPATAGEKICPSCLDSWS